ncbi:MAG: hypothetical protein OEW12_06390, partial [Deltaproteobacteria bacterium]|nr:hypothetical protein [Deltaproteobacteria bacterium]
MTPFLPKSTLTLVLAAALISGGFPAQGRAQQAESQGQEENLLDGFDATPAASKQTKSGKDSDNLLDQFGDAPPPAAGASSNRPPEQDTADVDPGKSWIELDGSLGLLTSTNYQQDPPLPGRADYRGLSRLKGAWRADLKLDLWGGWDSQISGAGFYDWAYGLKGRNQFTREVLRTHESEAEWRDAFIRGPVFDFMDIKFGRQIVAWGKSNFLRVVDVLNPLDNREPGMVDVVDLKLPVHMTRVDFYLGDFNLTGVAVHEILFNKNPAKGSDFDFYPQPEKEIIPASNSENTEYGARLAGSFSGWDAALYYADYFEDAPHVELEFTPPIPFPIPVLVHSRLKLRGAGFNVVAGNWLFKLEGARVEGLRWSNLDPGDTRSRTDGMAGVEYYGFSDTTIFVEVLDQRIENYDARVAASLGAPAEELVQYVAALNMDFLHKTLHFSGLGMFLGGKAEL